MSVRLSSKRGFSLALVLICASLAIATAFTLVAISTQHLRVVKDRAATQDALLLADQAVSQALSQLRANASWGQMHTEDVVVSPDADRQATVSFSSHGSPFYSTNNFNGADAAGWNGAVPPGEAEVVAVATSHGVQRVVDTLVSVPIFPYVLAVDGSMQVDGQLKALGPPSADPAMVNGDPNFPASVASNTSCAVHGTCVVTGDVVCPGTVDLPADAIVNGMVRKHSIQLPAIHASRWDPRGDPNAHLLTVAPTEALKLGDGHYYTGGDVSVGGLTMDGSLLYVNGDLTVTGGVTGRGTIIVAGRTRITGATSLAGADLVALIGEGDVTIDSNTTDTRFFQGLVYTQGNFSASNVTIVGCFIAAQADNDTVTGHSMKLQNVTAVYLPAAAQLSQATGLFGGSLVGTVYLPSLSSASFASGSFDNSQLLPASLPPNLLALAQQQQSAIHLPPGIVLVSTLGQVPYLQTQGAQQQQAPASPAGQQLMNRLVQQMAGVADFSGFVHRDPTTQQVLGVTLDEIYLPGSPTMVLQAEGIGYDPESNRFFAITPPAVFSVTVDNTTGATQYGAPDTFLAAAAARGVDGQGMLTSLLTAQGAMVQIANQMLVSNGQQSPPVNLSLNQFMENGVPLKVVSWQER